MTDKDGSNRQGDLPTEGHDAAVVASLPSSPAFDRSHFTVVFRGDIRKVPAPFKIKSDFGEVVACGYGNAFSKSDDLEAVLYRALPFVEDALCDPHYKSEPVADILRQINRALGEEATTASAVGTERSEVNQNTQVIP